MTEYYEIKKFNEYSVFEWDKFCSKSDDCWLWHTSYGLISKSFWHKHFNLSFYVVDKSNKKTIVAVVPLFLIKRRKLIDYSILDSLGGPALSPLINEKKNAGYHTIQWDAKNDLGEPVSAGMYIYIIHAGEYRSVKKMVLLK